MATNNAGSYFLLILSLFNFVALSCVIIYNIHTHYENNGSKQDNFRDDFFNDLKDEISDLFNGKHRRDAEQIHETKYLADIETILQNEKQKLLEDCKSVAKDEVIKVLKEALTYIQPLESDDKRRRQTNTAGNELASIFGEIAKTEVDILTQYCGNNSHICLPGDKGEKGDAGLVGLKGDPGQPGAAGINGVKGEPGLYGIPGSKGQRGVMGVQGMKGEPGGPGVAGVKGDTGLLGAQGPPGTAGSMGPKGEPGMYGVPGTKGQRGVMGPQGMKGELGHVGVKGDKGDMGLDGTSGAQGIQGPKGDKGAPADVPIPTFINPSSQCCNSLREPEFTEQLQELRVTEGSNVTLTCSPRGYPAPSVGWTPIPQGASLTPTTMRLTNLQVTDSKTLTCTANNALGSSSKNYVITVYHHLKFDKVPQNYTVMTGNPVTLECQIEGPMNPKISWYKILPGGSKSLVTNGIITTANNISQLHFDHVNSAIEGEYMCEGHNGVENVQMTAYLKTFGPPHIRPQGQITLMQGQTGRLRCQADSEPPATITWTYPPGVTNAYVDSDGSLVILNANARDSRYFICTASNQYGSDQEQLTVVVKSPPGASLSPVNIAVDPGRTAIALTCNATGDSPLKVDWFKDDIPLVGNSHLLILPGNVLLVNQANTADLGKYTCKASNSMGESSASSYAYVNAGDVQCPSRFSVCTQGVCNANCPAGCSTDPTPAVQIGVVDYTQASSICKAGIMSGVISSTGGQVMWRNIGFKAELLNVNLSP